jgi:hypothetical protein
MRQNLENENFLAGVKDSSDKAVFIPADIKYDAIADQAGAGEDLFDICPRMPRNGFVAYVSVPGTQGPLSVGVPWSLPKLSQPTFGDNSHPHLFLRSALRSIIVRKIRTSKMESRILRDPEPQDKTAGCVAESADSTESKIRCQNLRTNLEVIGQGANAGSAERFLAGEDFRRTGQD